MSKIITPSDLNSYTGKTLDSGRAQQVVDAINAYIENRTGRVWGESKDVTETINLNHTVFLRNMDVTAITSIKTGHSPNQVTAQSTSYLWSPTGRVQWLVPTTYMSAYPMNAMEVTYTHGVAAVPDDLKLAALGLASTMYTWADNGGQQVTSASVGSYRLEYASSRSGGQESAATNPAIANYSIIDSYRSRRT